MTENVGVKLLDGRFGPWQNVYPLEWPPPERLVAFRVDGRIAVADARHETRARYEFGSTAVYRKVSQSQLEESPEIHGVPMVRGAVYEAVT